MLLRLAPITVIAIILVVAPDAQPQTDGVATPPLLSVCEVLDQAAQYNGQLIKLRGISAGTDEGSWLRGFTCREHHTDGHTWPALIALVTPDMAEQRPNFGFDVESYMRSIEAYKRLRVKTRDECIEFTYTGLFQTRTDWSKFKLIYPDGRTKFVGFGHLSEAPAQLIMKSAESVTVIPGCR